MSPADFFLLSCAYIITCLICFTKYIVGVTNAVNKNNCQTNLSAKIKAYVFNNTPGSVTFSLNIQYLQRANMTLNIMDELRIYCSDEEDHSR